MEASCKAKLDAAVKETRKGTKEKYETKLNHQKELVKQLQTKLEDYEKTFNDERNKDAHVMRVVQQSLEKMQGENDHWVRKAAEQQFHIQNLEKLNASNLNEIRLLRRQLQAHGQPSDVMIAAQTVDFSDKESDPVTEETADVTQKINQFLGQASIVGTPRESIDYEAEKQTISVDENSKSVADLQADYQMF